MENPFAQDDVRDSSGAGAEESTGEASASDGRSRGVQSVEVGIKLLIALSRSNGPMSLRDLSASVGMSPAKVHRYMVSFVETGFVDHQRSGSYDLGHAAGEVGMAALTRVDVIGRASEKLPELVERANAAGVLCVWTDKGAMVVRWEREREPLSVQLSVGSRMPVVGSATGRAFAGHLPDHVVLPVFTAEAPHMVHDLDAIRGESNDGTIYRGDETSPGLFSLARPMLDYHGQAQAVVTLISTRRSLIKTDGPAEQYLREF